jgi:hypothetical protein
MDRAVGLIEAQAEPARVRTLLERNSRRVLGL